MYFIYGRYDARHSFLENILLSTEQEAIAYVDRLAQLKYHENVIEYSVMFEGKIIHTRHT